MLPCYTTQPTFPKSVAARYYVIVRNQTGLKVAWFDDWLSLEFGKIVDGLDYYTLTIRGDDPRRSLFELDGMVEVFRSVPACNVNWYREFVGLHRGIGREINENGEKFFRSAGVGLNDFLSRTTILYKADSAQSRKALQSETVMKQYVNENCGTQATVANGRLLDGVLPYFMTESTSDLGVAWSGDRAFENLLDTLRSIASYANIDFNVEATGYPLFEFKTFMNQLGDDRTIGNSSGNQPIIFGVDRGNIGRIQYSYDRMNEVTVATIVGSGSGSTRLTVSAVATDTRDDSPWNRREVCRSGNAQDLSEMAIQAVEELATAKAKEELSFVPIQLPSCLYALHYFVGDKVSVVEDGISYKKRLLQMKGVIANNQEQLSFEFGDVI